MSNQLSLSNIRNVLTRLEETIIFGLIERAQFRQNRVIYERDGVGKELAGESLVGFLLHECECSHAKVRRYTSPDEHPFYDDLPEPILPAAVYDNPLHPNAINVNGRIRTVYEEEIVPFVCEAGEDGQWGSSAVNDVMNLQSISKRIHYGKFVAESKFQSNSTALEAVIRAGDREALISAITDEDVESKVLERVLRKASTYGRELEAEDDSYRVRPEVVRDIYARWIIPMNKEVQVEYLLQRLSGG